MCLCCCTTRKSIFIYVLIISIIGFIFGLIYISNFASSTTLYKMLIDKIKYLEAHNTNNNYYNSNYDFRRNDYYNSYSPYYNDYNYNYNNYNSYYNNYNSNYNNDIIQKAKDLKTEINIESLTNENLNQNSYKLIKSLKGIEKGLGTILFIAPLIFFIFAIIFMISICGKRETQILTTQTFKLCSIIRIIVVILCVIFDLLSVVYFILLIIIYFQYTKLIDNHGDTCANKIILGIIYGGFSCWLNSNISNAFIKEAKLFEDVGEENKIGPSAEFDLNGNPIGRPVQINSNINEVNAQNVAQNGINPIYQQVQTVNTQNQGTVETQKKIQTESQNNIEELNLHEIKQVEEKNENIV